MRRRLHGLSESDLLLDEAQETENEYDSYDSAAEDEFYNGEDSADENPYKGRVFHPFSKLPPELRVRVWELALEEEAQPRILQFDLDLLPRLIDSEFEDDFVIDWTVHPSKQLAIETRHVRRMIAVNREARAVVLKTLPHTLTVRSRKIGHRPATIYLHRDRDIAHISGDEDFVDRLRFELREVWQEGRCDFEGFAENVTQLAIDCRSLEFIDEFDDEAIYAHILRPLPNLKRLFLELPRCEELRLPDKIWAGSEYVYTHEVAIRDRGNGYYLEKRVWPNADEYDDFVRQLPVPTFQQPGLPSTKRLTELSHGAMILPMFVFEDRGGYGVLEKLQATWEEAYLRGIPIEELSDWSLDGVDDLIEQIFGHREPNEYESEGIDDSEIMGYGTDDYSDADDLSGDRVYGDVYSSDEDDDDGSDSGSDAVIGHPADNNVPNGDAGAFSSPEPEPEPSSTSGTRNSRKRRIVADSDDELPSEVSRKKQARKGGFSAGIRSDTDDESVTETSAPRKRRRRAAVVDSDDEDGDSEDDGNGAKGTGKGETGKKSNDSGQEDSDDDEEDTSDEEEQDDTSDTEEEEQKNAVDVRQLSLATRLELVPPKHHSSFSRRNDSTDESEDDEEDDDDDEDDDEDDEDDDEDDEDDERSEDGLIDGIAEESDMSD